LLVLLAACGCRDHSAAAPAQAKSSPDSPAAVVQQVRVETEQGKSCLEFVHGFYDWYFDRINEEKGRATAGPNSYEVLTLKPQVLAPELRQMLKEDVEATSKNRDEIVGLDFDPFINAQDWEGKYWVNSVNVKDGTCRASVWGMDADKKRDIVHPQLKITNGNWIFVDFFYPETTGRADASLMGILTDLRDERERTTNERPHK
jgi:hypothetical protein